MKEFILAVEDEAADQEREDAIEALVAQGKTREEAEVEVDRGTPIEFKIGERVLKAYKPNETQLIFLLASLGRGQSKESRMASIVNVMLESLDEDDKDWFEERLLTSDPTKRIPPRLIESVFEYLTSEWFREGVSGDGAPVPDRG
jgi:hypothetical protein